MPIFPLQYIILTRPHCSHHSLWYVFHNIPFSIFYSITFVLYTGVLYTDIHYYFHDQQRLSSKTIGKGPNDWATNGCVEITSVLIHLNWNTSSQTPVNLIKQSLKTSEQTSEEVGQNT